MARSKIVATAIDLFSRHGVEKVTVEHIADVADVGKGTIYNYFATKEDLVVAFMVELEERLQTRLMRQANASASLESALQKYIRFHFREKRKYKPFVRIFVAQLVTQGPEFLSYVVKIQKAIDPPLEAMFRKLQERGELRRDVSLVELINAFKTLQLGLTMLWAMPGTPDGLAEKVAAQQVKLFCEGWRAKRR